MKNIKLLLSVIIALLILNLLKVIFYISYSNYLDTLLNASTEGHLLVVIYLITIVLLIAAHILLSKGLWHIISDGYFNIKSIKALNLGGILFIIYGVATLCWKLYIIHGDAASYGSIMSHVIIRAFEDGYTIILGLAIITINSVLKNAFILKSENDLTI